MYILIDAYRDVKPGDVVVIKSDRAGGIGAFLIGGEKIGELSGSQPEGCLDFWTVASNLYDNRVLCDVAVKCGSTVILHTESRLFAWKSKVTAWLSPNNQKICLNRAYSF